MGDSHEILDYGDRLAVLIGTGRMYGENVRVGPTVMHGPYTQYTYLVSDIAVEDWPAVVGKHTWTASGFAGAMVKMIPGVYDSYVRIPMHEWTIVNVALPIPRPKNGKQYGWVWGDFNGRWIEDLFPRCDNCGKYHDPTFPYCDKCYRCHKGKCKVAR